MSDADGHSQRQGSATPRKRRKVTRSRAGCLTCRRRRKLCDFQKPICGACSRLKVECTWPDLDRERDRRGILLAPTPGAPGVVAPERSVIGGNGNGSDRGVQPGYGSASSINAFFNAVALQGSTESSNTTGQVSNPLPNLDELFGLDFFGADLQVDDATLQAWAAECMTLPSDAIDPTLLLTPASNNLSPTAETRVRLDPVPPQASTSLDHQGGSTDSALISYFTNTLSSLVSVTPSSVPSAFEAFTRLSSLPTARGNAAQALHLSIMAWAGAHAVNNGQPRFEIMSARLGDQATALISTRLAQGYEGTDEERLTMLAAALMVVQYKICRGDVSGYRWLVNHLRQLGGLIYRPDDVNPATDSMHFHFFENLVYHDVLSSFISTSGPMVSQEVITRYSASASESLHSLTGVSLPVFTKIHRIAALHRQRREHGALDVWSDDQLLDLVRAAEEIEGELREEKRRLDAVLQAKPHLREHRYLHEAVRTACLLALRAHVLCEPPSTIALRLLVRQTLSLLETMCDQNLPGWCSAHWIMFITALCASDDSEDGDRSRVIQLYEETQEQFGFENSTRSLKIVREVWARNTGVAPDKMVDWLDVAQEWEWEMFLV